MERFQKLLSPLLYPSPALRAETGCACSEFTGAAWPVVIRHFGRLSDPAGQAE